MGAEDAAMLAAAVVMIVAMVAVAVDIVIVLLWTGIVQTKLFFRNLIYCGFLQAMTAAQNTGVVHQLQKFTGAAKRKQKKGEKNG